MPTPKYFSRCPEFPSDLKLANVPTVSFKKLQSQSATESEKLFEACTGHGFFLLDLRNSEDGEELLKDAEKMFDMTAATLTLGSEILNKYAYKPPNLIGYKAMGSLKTDDGKPDTMEIYSIGQDDMIGTSPPYENPGPIEARRQDCQAFFHHAYAAVCVILSHLDEKLGLVPNTLASLNPQDKPTATALRLLLSPPQNNPGEIRGVIPGHTDIGSITMLFHVAGGLQILPAGCENEEENWRYVRPEPNCALINLGDTIVEKTGGVVRSSLHRVVTPPGEQAGVTRQSLAYLVKADRNATMHRFKSSGVIPPPSEDDKEDARSVDEWAAEMSKAIIMGQVKPKGKGGRFGVQKNQVKV